MNQYWDNKGSIRTTDFADNTSMKSVKKNAQNKFNQGSFSALY